MKKALLQLLELSANIEIAQIRKKQNEKVRNVLLKRHANFTQDLKVTGTVHFEEIKKVS